MNYFKTYSKDLYCRTCARIEHKMTDIFSHYQLLPYKDIIMACTSVKIKSDDTMPSKICNECINFLQTAHKFKIQAEKADELFQKMIDLQTTQLNNTDSVIIKEEIKNEELKDVVTSSKNEISVEEKSLSDDEEQNSGLWHDDDDDSIETKLKEPEKVPKKVFTQRKNRTDSRSSIDFLKTNKEFLSKITNDVSKIMKTKLRRGKISKKESASDSSASKKSRNPSQCEVCGKIYTKASNLLLHLRAHSGERPYECLDCPKTFATRALLNNHIRTHTGLKPFDCEVCGKKFTRGASLKEHMFLHKGIKRHKCTICGRAFAQNYHMISHMRLHTGDRPFKCEICDLGFVTKSHRARHLKQHTGIKDFLCTQCGKCFLSRGELNKHLETHAPLEPTHQCSDCNKMFARKSSLGKHRRKIHK